MLFRQLPGILCLILSCGTWLAAAAAVPASRAVSPIDRILVVVNDDAITETELGVRLVQTKRELAVEKIKLPPDEVLRRQLLERMIIDRVQLQLAERAGIRVPDADVDRAIEDIAKANKMNSADFRRVLVQEGIDPQAHVAEIRSQLVIRQLLEREISNRVTVSEAEITDFLEAHPQGTDVEYRLAHIFLPLPESASPEAIQAGRKRAEDILSQLKNGANFAQLAVTYSQGEGAMNGGALGWKKAGQLPELFVTTLKDLPAGDVSEVLRGPNGFHLLQLIERRGDSPAANVAQTHVRHILMRGSEIQSLDEARARLLGLRQRIELGDSFEALARANSEDGTSAANGGDLGWVNPGQTVPAFEKAMNALKPNELSEPVSSPFGLHLIQVLERRSQDISKQRLEASARSQIHARKASERYEQWSRQVRDEAYVEYLTGDE